MRSTHLTTVGVVWRIDRFHFDQYESGDHHVRSVRAIEPQSAVRQWERLLSLHGQATSREIVLQTCCI